MNEGQMAFSRVMAHGSRFVLDRCIRRYDGNRRVRSFSCRDQYLAMSFAQLTYRGLHPNPGSREMRKFGGMVCTPTLVQGKCENSGFLGPGVSRAPAAKSAGVERAKLPWGRKLL
jgi:hypothetical protein